MTKLKPVLSLLIINLLSVITVFAQQPFVDGVWQTRLHRQDGADIVFNTEVKEENGRKVLYVLNAGDRLLVDDIQMEGDSIFIKMPFFDSEFRGAVQPGGEIKGLWIRHLANNDMSIPFTAIPGVKERFTQHQPAKGNVTGRWATYFKTPGKADSSFSVGEFKQQGNTVYGTFLTTTGDYRFLEGIMDGDTLKLSTFDGSHAYYFTARLTGDKTLENGVFYAGIGAAKETWTAQKDASAKLPDETTLTTIKPGESKLDFSFPDVNGKQVSISDARFKGKVVVITLMGSWCPNCMDETAYLSKWYEQNKQRGVEILGLAYERTTDFAKSQKALIAFMKRFNVQFPVLITGVTPTDPQKTEKTLPQLTGIKGYPTTLFVDKKGQVKEVHTGFSGPGTGEHYEQYQKDFNHLIDELLKEK
ncbi:TlpA family protein disulfide reductase [Chitinophaga agrisoli]|uniref:TlpA family protein disulfide reductase n=1 Tax=Chitinophaga agrisoli TaxID=2607653 RepID=A0A5B2VLI5_9BACT|nr:TlpA disulfide reductase family protein [Chitinophaga agrisoli]KAA2239765.1 TlpA family protein disulfide reductase [Chitinophaga agrisoli]